MPTFCSSSPGSFSFQDWKFPRTAKSFIGYRGEKNPPNSFLRCVTNTKIPCTFAEFQAMGEKVRFSLTVLSVTCVGWAKAPYKKSNGKKKVSPDPNSKSLYQLVKSEDTSEAVVGVKINSFKKANSNFDRGDFDDSKSCVIHVGQVLTFFVHPFMYQSNSGEVKQRQLFPQDNGISSIPEFTIVDIMVGTSHVDCSEGYGLKLMQISLHPTSLYSYLGKESLQLLPSSLSGASEISENWARESPFIMNQVATKNVSFFAKVPVYSFVSAEPSTPGVYRIHGPDQGELFPGVPSVDIKESDLLKYTNIVVGQGEEAATFVLDAITLLDFAAAADALWVYVVSVQQYKTGDPGAGDFHGVPMVDTDTFLQCIDFKDKAAQAEAGDDSIDEQELFKFPRAIPNLSDSPVVTVFTNPITKSIEASGLDAPCSDFSLMSEACNVKRGYLVTVGRGDYPDVLRFVFNVMGCQGGGVGGAGGAKRVDYAAARQQAVLAGKRKADEIAESEGSGGGGVSPVGSD